MENQHRKITGYRELNQVEIDLMNRIKQMGKDLEDLVFDVKAFHSQESGKLNSNLQMVQNSINCTAEQEKEAELPVDDWSDAEPERWRALGRTSLQQGLMFLVRSVARPKFF